MEIWKHYYTPATVDEALALLAEHAGNARIIAGGTDLLIDLQFAEKMHQHRCAGRSDSRRLR